MGNLRDGKWTDEDTLNEDQGGKYVKVPARFRNWITANGSSGFKAEPGRYVLYSSIGCPWAHRAVLFRTLKKLEGIIELVNTEQVEGGRGEGCRPWRRARRGGGARRPLRAGRAVNGHQRAPTATRLPTQDPDPTFFSCTRP